VHFTFPARDQAPGVELYWYDGDRQPPREVTGVDQLPSNGVIFVGERALLFAPDYGRLPILMPKKTGDVITAPKAYLPQSPGHHQEWVRACKQDLPTSCDFSYGARLTETCLLGNIAIAVNKPLQWDAHAAQFDSAAANDLLRNDYRDGWAV